MANLTILEPMSTGDVIDRAVRLYRRNFTPLIAAIVLPSIIGYVASLMFWYGYTSLVLGSDGSSAPADSALAFLVFGLFGYLVWFFILLFMLCGLSRTVADHVMLGDAITFRMSLSAAGKKLGDIIVMGLLLLGALFALYILFVIVVFVAALIMGVIIGLTASAQFPRWLASTIIVITVLIILALGIFVLLLILSRITFLPQVVMIEGQRVGNALGRAIRLGAKNWYKVGAIVLFIYFVSASLHAALTLPVLAGVFLLGHDPTEFFFSPTGSILYMSFSQLSNILVLPLWVVSYTLLYFDSRVRKEAYDLELLAAEVGPGFHWTPSMHGPPVSYRPTPPTAVVQTSPLGLSGTGISTQPVQVADDSRSSFNPSVVSPQPPALTHSLTHSQTHEQTEPGSTFIEQPSITESESPRNCPQCGAGMMPRARFCIRCGAQG